MLHRQKGWDRSRWGEPGLGRAKGKEYIHGQWQQVSLTPSGGGWLGIGQAIPGTHPHAPLENGPDGVTPPNPSTHPKSIPGWPVPGKGTRGTRGGSADPQRSCPEEKHEIADGKELQVTTAGDRLWVGWRKSQSDLGTS